MATAVSALAPEIMGLGPIEATRRVLARARLKRDLAAGRVALAEVLSEPPACVEMAKVRELLLAVPGIGPAKADRAFAHCRIAEAKTVAGLSGRQRAALVELLRG